MSESICVVTGIANDHSLGWYLADELYKKGEKVLITYQNEATQKRALKLIEGTTISARHLDVSSPESVKLFFSSLQGEGITISKLVHSIAFADREDLNQEFFKVSRDGFLKAMDISVYSFIEMAREALPLLTPGASLLTMTYYGSQKVVPNYNIMGVAKAALESAVRYLAADLGPKNIRVNALSAGPVRTLAAAGIKDFRSMLHQVEARAPLKRNVDPAEVAKTGLFLLGSDASGITGQTIYVDSGISIMAF